VTDVALICLGVGINRYSLRYLSVLLMCPRSNEADLENFGESSEFRTRYESRAKTSSWKSEIRNVISSS